MRCLRRVVRRKSATAGNLDGSWRELKVLLVAWFDGLCSYSLQGGGGGCLAGGFLLNACIAMIPKADGDATPLGQLPLSVLPVVYRVWASARMVQLEDWFWSWGPGIGFQRWWGSWFGGSVVHYCIVH